MTFKPSTCSGWRNIVLRLQLDMKNEKNDKASANQNRSDDLNGRLKTLVLVAVAWVILFVLVLAEHARSWARLLPMIGVVWFLYAAYATWKYFTDKRNQ
jgi:hypothetical protein